ncbi:glutathione S-transferase N-terminal domain-containing protein [Magnetospirillum molischianum]|uniref:Putative Glutathione S-transferase n=1 Tax=Magnetospirillum molischianum DSM 120 TaxID=1150626 RepID=H8FQR7_MAGML|nr:glutathione S-transferase N-terminal domain-containing protein [Magnetospirillum molischianum]CCG40705.1 putative Glutathione S-transferase [Magnetospirillum molischianum DSM 120]
MKLRTSATSPYARKVWIVAHEAGLVDRIEAVPTNVWDPATDVVRDNPLGKVPALIADGGEAIYDSPVICEYLDSLHDGQKLVPATGGARWTQKRLEALADGILDALLAKRVETTMRPEEKRWPDWIARQEAAADRGLAQLEDEVSAWGDTFQIGQIAVVAALGYLDFRFPETSWRSRYPALAAWYVALSRRPSVAATEPVA